MREDGGVSKLYRAKIPDESIAEDVESVDDIEEVDEEDIDLVGDLVCEKENNAWLK